MDPLMHYYNQTYRNRGYIEKNDDVGVIRPDRVPKSMYASISLCMSGNKKLNVYHCLYTYGMFKALTKTVNTLIHAGS